MRYIKQKKYIAEHYRSVSHGLRGLRCVYSALEKLDTDVRNEYDAIFSYLYKYNTRSVVSASLNYNLSTASIYRRLSHLCRLMIDDSKIRAKIKHPQKGEIAECFMKEKR